MTDMLFAIVGLLGRFSTLQPKKKETLSVVSLSYDVLCWIQAKYPFENTSPHHMILFGGETKKKQQN